MVSSPSPMSPRVLTSSFSMHCLFHLLIISLTTSSIRALSSIRSNPNHPVTSSGSTSKTSSSNKNNNIIKILYDSSNNNHRDLQYHPEQPSRIDACVDLLQQHNSKDSDDDCAGVSESTRRLFFDLIDVAPASSALSASTAINVANESNESNEQDHSSSFFSSSFLQTTRSILTQIHSEEYVNAIQIKCHSSRTKRIQDNKHPLGFVGYIDHDTFLTTESYDVCLRATACWMYCVEQVMMGVHEEGKEEDVEDIKEKETHYNDLKTCMALTRPPGHHATKSIPNGFCIFNFAAAAAVYASTQIPKCTKVSIIDWDVHYGQGVADIIQNYPNIRYVSMHQVPAFPYSGQSRSIFGQYQNVKTVPIQPDSTWKCGYETMFTEEVLPFCYDQVEWDADLIIVCAGYDALNSDELASCSLNANDFGTMTTLLKEYVGLVRMNEEDEKKYEVQQREKRHVGLMFGLEGGYQLGKDVPGGNLPDAVLATLKAAAAI